MSIFQLVMRGFNSKFLLFFLLVIFSLRSYAQCPESVVLENPASGNALEQELVVYDNFNSGVDIQDFELNIYHKLSGKYILAETSNFPMITANNDIEIRKSGDRIQIRNMPEEVNLMDCTIILIGEDCPASKIEVTGR